MNVIEQIQAIDKALPNDIKNDICKTLNETALLSEVYCQTIKHYNPGGIQIPSDKQYEFTRLLSRLKAYWNQYLRVIYLGKMNIELKDCDIDLTALRVLIRKYIVAYLEKVKEYMNVYGDRCMVQMVHYILCDAEIPVKIANEWTFYKRLYEHQVVTINHMRKKDLLESLRYEYGEYIQLFKENRTFKEKDYLVAGVLLGFCRENSINGERTALYFKSIVDRKVEEDIPQEQIIRIMDTLFKEGYLDGYKAGKFRFIFEHE